MPHQESVILTEAAVREDEQELSALRSLVGGLQRVRDTGREVPQITRALDHCEKCERRDEKE